MTRFSECCFPASNSVQQNEKTNPPLSEVSDFIEQGYGTVSDMKKLKKDITLTAASLRLVACENK